MNENIFFPDVAVPIEATMTAEKPAKTGAENAPEPAAAIRIVPPDPPKPQAVVVPHFFSEPEPDLSLLPAFPQPPVETPPSDTWHLLSLNCMFGLNNGPVELSIKMALPYHLAEPLVEEGNQRIEEMRRRIGDRLASSAEHQAYRVAACRLKELEEERDRLDQVLAGTDRQLAESALSPDELAQLSADEAETKTRRGMVERAIAHAQRARDDAARAVHRIAGSIAAQERSRALDAVATAERDAAGLFKVAREQLAELVTTSALGGAIRNPWWPQHAADSAATELTGPCPPPPAPPPTEKPANPLAWLSNPPNAPPAVVGGMAR
jgi:hypothetical protein